MKKNNFQAMFILIILIFCVAIVPAQSGKSDLNQQIRNLVNQYYLLKESAPDGEKLLSILAEDFVFTDADGKTIPKREMLKTWQLNSIDFFAHSLDRVKDRFNLKIEPEIADLQVQQTGDKADFKLTRTLHRLLTIRGEKPETFQKTERFVITGAVSRRAGKWLLSVLPKSQLKNEDLPAEKSEEAKFDAAILMLYDAAGEKEIEQKRQDAQANLKLEKEVQQFFVDSGLVTASNKTQKRMI